MLGSSLHCADRSPAAAVVAQATAGILSDFATEVEIAAQSVVVVDTASSFGAVDTIALIPPFLHPTVLVGPAKHHGMDWSRAIEIAG